MANTAVSLFMRFKFVSPRRAVTGDLFAFGVGEGTQVLCRCLSYQASCPAFIDGSLQLRLSP